MTNSGTSVTYFHGSFAADGRQNPAPSERNELADIFAGADVGLALFDSELSLLACNSLYRSLCGYLSSDATTGQKLQTLMRVTFERLNVPKAEIDEKIDRVSTLIARTLDLKFNVIQSP